jgi:hypothetical protein
MNKSHDSAAAGTPARQTNPLIVSYGGGVNSLAMLIRYLQLRTTVDAIVFSDTRDAARARGWAARVRAGWKHPATPAPAGVFVSDAAF